MSKAVGRRAHVLEIRKKLNEDQFDIAIESDQLVDDAAAAARLEKAKQHYASCRVQGIVRGFLSRALFKELVQEYRAAKFIQRVMRGKLGRMKWMREYWKSLSVVKSPEALRELLKRSVFQREAKLSGSTTYWKEFFDPVSNMFWYYESRSMLSTWNCPVALQKNLVCSWNGFQDFGGLPSVGKCRKVFDNVAEYHGHVRDAHRWHCVSCSAINGGAVFPMCGLCGNDSSENAEDGDHALKHAMAEVQSKMAIFMATEKSSIDKSGDKYVLKNRMIQLSLEKTERVKQKRETLKNKRNGVVAEEDEESKSGSSKSRGTVFADSRAAGISDESTKGSKKKSKHHEHHHKKSKPMSVKQLEAEEKRAKGLEWDQQDSVRREKQLHVTGCLLPLAPLFNLREDEEGRMIKEEAPPLLYQSKGENQYAGLFRSVQEAAEHKVDVELGGREGEKERFRDPVTRGLIPTPVFDSLTKSKIKLDGDETSQAGGTAMAEDSDDDLMEAEERAQAELEGKESVDGSQAASGKDSKGEESSIGPDKVDGGAHEMLMDAFREMEAVDGLARMQCCAAFLEGRCSKTSCPLAHPGIRDSVEVQHMRLPGRVKKIAFVACCPHYNGNAHTGCAEAGSCPNYHIYIRPSTRDIILRIYPKKKGENCKVMPSGAEVTGTRVEGKLHGFGVMTWASGATYSGDWKNDQREGLGIYRTPKGTEYSGGWLNGKRHGFGCYINSIGEEYVGHWEDGRMHGVGRLRSANGDYFEGEFKHHRYDGVGIFTKANGDKFMGFCRDGMACGLGVLALGTGEKYKGHFDRNLRHGKGACAYPTGARYAGEWYRGTPEGFGVFVAPNGERYVGGFSAGKKHGQGRYFFLDGSFYDGTFFKNKAKDFGVYFFASGDKYAGNWENDKRNGRGTYKYANGSVYTGNWVNNNIDGKGKFDWSYGAHYRGEFKMNSKHGRGIFTWPNGNVYRGQFDHEKICGAGEMTYASGHKYVGMWRDNKKNGEGTFTYVNGAVYSGAWVDDTRHGKGKLAFLPGTFVEEYYEGDWVDDMKHGKGKYVFRKDEGTMYEGDWEKDRRHGQGKIAYKDGSYYRGDFEHEKMHGQGVYIGADGSQYQGDWEHNMRQGEGTLLAPDGSIYHGQFHQNMRHGNGKLQYPDGNIYEGVWEGNVIRGEGLTGKYTLMIGDTVKGGPEQVTLRCFPY